MKAYFTNLPTRTWLLIVLPAVVIAYPVGRHRGAGGGACGRAGSRAYGAERDLKFRRRLIADRARLAALACLSIPALVSCIPALNPLKYGGALNLVPPQKTIPSTRSKTKDPRPKTGSDEPHPDELHPDELWMEEALRCAQRALEAGEVPVGAVVVCDGPDRGTRMESQHHGLRPDGPRRDHGAARSRCYRW